MKSILISIKPKWVAKILNGEKTIEIRKTAPKEWTDYLYGKTNKKPKPITGYIYCTKGKKYEFLTEATDGTFVVGGLFCAQLPRNGRVVAKFMLREIELIWHSHKYFYLCDEEDKKGAYEGLVAKRGCISTDELHTYLKGRNGYAWHISDLVIFDKPKELSEFNLKRPPQSWFFIKER